LELVPSRDPTLEFVEVNKTSFLQSLARYGAINSFGEQYFSDITKNSESKSESRDEKKSKGFLQRINFLGENKGDSGLSNPIFKKFFQSNQTMSPPSSADNRSTPISTPTQTPTDKPNSAPSKQSGGGFFSHPFSIGSSSQILSSSPSMTAPVSSTSSFNLNNPNPRRVPNTEKINLSRSFPPSATNILRSFSSPMTFRTVKEEVVEEEMKDISALTYSETTTSETQDEKHFEDYHLPRFINSRRKKKELEQNLWVYVTQTLNPPIAYRYEVECQNPLFVNFTVNCEESDNVRFLKPLVEGLIARVEVEPYKIKTVAVVRQNNPYKPALLRTRFAWTTKLASDKQNPSSRSQSPYAPQLDNENLGDEDDEGSDGFRED